MTSDVQRGRTRGPVSNALPYYTLSEVAKLLGVHYETAARWVRAGKLQGVKLSRRKVVVPRAGCEALLSGHPSEPMRRPGFGSVQRWLPLIGALSPKEAASLRASAEDFEKVEDES